MIKVHIDYLNKLTDIILNPLWKDITKDKSFQKKTERSNTISVLVNWFVGKFVIEENDKLKLKIANDSDLLELGIIHIILTSLSDTYDKIPTERRLIQILIMKLYDILHYLNMIIDEKDFQFIYPFLPIPNPNIQRYSEQSSISALDEFNPRLFRFINDSDVYYEGPYIFPNKYKINDNTKKNYQLIFQSIGKLFGDVDKLNEYVDKLEYLKTNKSEFVGTIDKIYEVRKVNKSETLISFLFMLRRMMKATNKVELEPNIALKKNTIIFELEGFHVNEKTSDIQKFIIFDSLSADGISLSLKDFTIIYDPSWKDIKIFSTEKWKDFIISDLTEFKKLYPNLWNYIDGKEDKTITEDKQLRKRLISILFRDIIGKNIILTESIKRVLGYSFEISDELFSKKIIIDNYSEIIKLNVILLINDIFNGINRLDELKEIFVIKSLNSKNDTKTLKDLINIKEIKENDHKILLNQYNSIKEFIETKKESIKKSISSMQGINIDSKIKTVLEGLNTNTTIPFELLLITPIYEELSSKEKIQNFNQSIDSTFIRIIKEMIKGITVINNSIEFLKKNGLDDKISFNDLIKSMASLFRTTDINDVTKPDKLLILPKEYYNKEYTSLNDFIQNMENLYDKIAGNNKLYDDIKNAKLGDNDPIIIKKIYDVIKQLNENLQEKDKLNKMFEEFKALITKDIEEFKENKSSENYKKLLGYADFILKEDKIKIIDIESLIIKSGIRFVPDLSENPIKEKGDETFIEILAKIIMKKLDEYEKDNKNKEHDSLLHKMQDAIFINRDEVLNEKLLIQFMDITNRLHFQKLLKIYRNELLRERLIIQLESNNFNDEDSELNVESIINGLFTGNLTVDHVNNITDNNALQIYIVIKKFFDNRDEIIYEKDDLVYFIERDGELESKNAIFILDEQSEKVDTDKVTFRSGINDLSSRDTVSFMRIISKKVGDVAVIATRHTIYKLILDFFKLDEKTMIRLKKLLSDNVKRNLEKRIEYYGTVYATLIKNYTNMNNGSTMRRLGEILASITSKTPGKLDELLIKQIKLINDNDEERIFINTLYVIIKKLLVRMVKINTLNDFRLDNGRNIVDEPLFYDRGDIIKVINLNDLIINITPNNFTTVVKDISDIKVILANKKEILPDKIISNETIEELNKEITIIDIIRLINRIRSIDNLENLPILGHIYKSEKELLNIGFYKYCSNMKRFGDYDKIAHGYNYILCSINKK